MLEVSFAMTTEAAADGSKTQTRRFWKPSHAAKFKLGTLFCGIDKDRRAGGKPIGIFLCTKTAYTQRLGDMTETSFLAEGGTRYWRNREGYITAMGGPDRVPWVLEFRLFTTALNTTEYDLDQFRSQFFSKNVPVKLTFRNGSVMTLPAEDSSVPNAVRGFSGPLCCPPLRDSIMPRPRIVCLCGSTRFMDAFRRANLEETLAGNIVLTIGCDTKSDADLLACGQLTPELKQRLDELHKRKIELADEIKVLNVGGYIGASTASEIEHAKRLGKGIRYLEATDMELSEQISNANFDRPAASAATVGGEVGS